jgi:hypothetical protein
MNVLSLELLDQNISECRAYVEAGKEDPTALEFLLKLREDLSHASKDDWYAFNELNEHLPDKNADPVLIILKGQLLLERLVQKFIDSRLPNPSALEKQQLTAAQSIALAESMCLPNDEPKWLWAQVRELNAIRNKLAHTLDSENIDKRISNFISTVSNAQNLRSKSISS